MPRKRAAFEPFCWAVEWPDGAYAIFTDGQRARDFVDNPDGMVKNCHLIPLYPDGVSGCVLGDIAVGDRCHYRNCEREVWFGVGPHECSMFCEHHHRGLAHCGMTIKDDEYVAPEDRPGHDPSNGDNPNYQPYRPADSKRRADEKMADRNATRNR